MRIEPHPLYPDKYVVVTDLLEKQLSDGIQLVLSDGSIVNPLELEPAIDEAEKAEIEAAEAAEQAAEQAVIDFRNLPDWASWTGAEAAEALRTGILNGMTKAEARAAIDAQFDGVNSLATLGAAVVAVLKQLADAVIDGRDLGHQNEARAIMYLRDIVVK